MKQALILLHGALGSKSYFEPYAEALSNEFNVFTFNFSGHGGGVFSEPFTTNVLVHEVLEEMKVQKIEKAHFFGYSMGGYVALQLAYSYPEKVDKIMTLGTKLAWNPEISAKECQKLNPEIIKEKVPKFADMLAQIHGSGNWEMLMNRISNYLYLLGNGGAIQETEFTQIKSALLICLADGDNMVSREECESLSKLIPNSKFEILSNSKHPFEQVNQEELIQAIKKFML